MNNQSLMGRATSMALGLFISLSLGWSATTPVSAASPTNNPTNGPATNRDKPLRAYLAVYPLGLSLEQSSGAGWTLAKTGAVDRNAGTVTWQITAAPTGTARNTLILTGRVTLLNLGNTPATLGNVVVNLDAKAATGNSWSTVASNVATATLGDAATSAKIIGPSDGDADEDYDDTPLMTVRTVSEGPASGSLTFTQGAAPLSLSPTKSIAPGGSLELRFTATFNNTVLNLAAGRVVRAELIVTSGNAGMGPRTIASIDIDGSGAISADEARVRSKARRLGNKALPAPTASPSTPATISDTLADIATTGTVAFSNAVFTLGATTGTVKVNVSGGANGGEITNCAKLTGSGVALQACNTQRVNPAAAPCAVPGAAGCGWEDGEVVSFGDDDWGNALSTAGGLALANFATVYAATGGDLNVGIVGIGVSSLTLTSAAAAIAYLPDTGPPGVLDNDYANPPFTSAGSLGSNIVALKLNIDFSDAGYFAGSSGLGVGDLTLCGVGSGLDGQSVRHFFAAANVLLGGGPSTLTPTGASALAVQINTAFVDGLPSAFAQSSLVNGSCN